MRTLGMDVSDARLGPSIRELRIDLVLSANLIEHVAEDVGAVKSMVAGLPKGGYLALLVPAMPSIYGSLDTLDCHQRRYTPRTLRTVVKASDVTIETLRHFNVAGALGWWLKGRVLRQTEQTASNYRLMNRLIPVLRPIERLLPPPFGLSLIAIARR